MAQKSVLNDTNYSKGKIGQALYVENTQGIFGFADQIKDLTENKFQDVINAELRNKLEEVGTNLITQKITNESNKVPSSQAIYNLLGNNITGATPIIQITETTLNSNPVWMITKQNGNSEEKYYVGLTKVTAPDKPTITVSGTTLLGDGSTVSSNPTFTLSGVGTKYYSFTTDGNTPGDPKTSYDKAISVTNNFTTNSSTYTLKIKAKTYYSNLWSSIAEKSETITRKLKTPSFTVTNNWWDTSRVVTVTTNCDSAVTTTVVDSNGDLLTANGKTLSNAVSVNGTKYTFTAQNSKTGWVSSDSKTQSVTVGKAQAYYGAYSLIDSSVTDDNIKEVLLSRLTAANSVKPDSISATTTATNKYVYFVLPKGQSFTKLQASATLIWEADAMNKLQTNVYDIYRSDSQQVDSFTFTVI